MTVKTTRRAAVATVVALTVVSGCSSESQDRSSPTPSGSVWVANEGEDSLSVIDAATNAVTTTLNGIEGPHNVQIARDGAVVYAVSSSGVVVAIDSSTYQVSAVAPTGSEPAHVIEAPNGRVYVTNAGDGTVSVYRAQGLVPSGRIPLGGMPHGQRSAAGGSVIVVANMMNGALDLIDPATDKSVGAVPVGKSPVQVAVSADGKYAYTGISDPPSVVKVDLNQRKVVGTAPVPNSPVQLYLTPDERTVLSANQGTREVPGDTVSAIATEAMTSRATVTTGAGPHGVVIDAGGNWAWVTNNYADTVTPIDLSALTALAPIPVGSQPNGISYSSRPPAPSPSTVVTLEIPIPPALDPGSESDPHSGHH